MIKTGNKKPSIAVLMCTLLILFSASGHSDPNTIQGLISAGDLDAALRLADEALEKDRENVTYRFLKGLVLTRQGKLESARDIFLDLTRTNPELPEPYNNLAVVYAALGDFDQARNALEEAINTHPAYATAHENMGDIYARLASQAYNQALELNADNNTAKAKLSLVNELFSAPQTLQPEISADTRQIAATAQGPADSSVSALAPRALPAETISSVEKVEQSAVTVIPVQEQPLVTQIPEARTEETRPQELPKPGPQLTETHQKQPSIAAIKQGVLDWAQAWSGQDVDAYLSFYARDFSPSGGLSRAVWEASRRQKVAAPEFIKVTVTDLVVEMLGSDHAQAVFTQIYQSDTYGDRVKKTLLMKIENDRWLITQEETK